MMQQTLISGGTWTQDQTPQTMHPGAWMQKKWYLTYAGDRVQSSCYWTSHSGLKYLTDFREWQWV